MSAQPDASLAPNAQAVHRLAENLGFALLGIAPAQPSEHADHIRGWLAKGSHGDMQYLADHLDQRLDPRALVPGARSVICVGDVYQDTCEANDGSPIPDPLPARRDPIPLGRIARYAWGDDYHRVMKNRLHALADALRERWPEHEYRTTVDTAPILEREHAQRAGLGWVGKHTLLIHPDLGSWFLLGEIVTTLPLQPTTETAGPVSDHCGTCTRCIDACPTQCITPYQMDGHRCISYLTLEYRGLIDPALHGPMGDWIGGCDVCQEVCPFNKRGQPVTTASSTSHTPHPTSQTPIRPAYAPRPPAPAIPLLELLGWNAADRQSAFERSALKRLKLDQLKRNALIAAGNYLAKHKGAALQRRIQELADDAQESELVRETARQVLQHGLIC